MGEKFDAWWEHPTQKRSQSERLSERTIASMHRKDAVDDMYNALWEVVELSDRTLPPSGRTAECQRV